MTLSPAKPLPPGLRVIPLVGADAAPHLPALARLRIEVFREWPYLYDGTEAYEQKYLRTFLATPGALLVAVFDGAEVVGASTAMPMEHAQPEFRAPFDAAGLDAAGWFYFPESVLRAGWRDRGIGHHFFVERERHALSFPRVRHAAFCAVERPADHPLRPAGHRDLYDYWNRRGYVKRPEFTTTFRWRDIDGPDETAKTMTFWVKALRGG